MSTVNTGLLDLVLKTIEADQAHWNQMNWRTISQGEAITVDGRQEYPVTCHAAFCFAGWAIQLGSEQRPKWVNSVYLWANQEDDSDNVRFGRVAADIRAQRLLGLTNRQAGRLFYGGNTLAGLKELVNTIKKEEL